MMFGIWILWIALIVLVVWGVKEFADNRGRDRKTGEDDKSASEILRERYARGEIDKEEFDERMQTLSH